MNFTNGELSFARILVTFGNSLKVDLKQTCCFSYIESITAVHVIPRRAKLWVISNIILWITLYAYTVNTISRGKIDVLSLDKN